MHPTEVQVNWPFGSGEEAKNRFLRWSPQKASLISDRNDFTYLALQITLVLPTKFQLAFGFRRRSEK